jgi:hypothetical protein
MTISSQSNESLIIDEIIQLFAVPRYFVEFGFGATELNCANLIKSGQGLAIDGNKNNCELARAIYPASITVLNEFLNLQNLNIVTDYVGNRELGILSIDVDGNDWWFASFLLRKIKPQVIITEYNASFLHYPVTVPYDPNFERHKHHPSGLYHGASLVAFQKLCYAFGYFLYTTSDSGVNAFFVRRDLYEKGLNRKIPPLLTDPALYKENKFRNSWLKNTAPEQWLIVKDLNYVYV